MCSKLAKLVKPSMRSHFRRLPHHASRALDSRARVHARDVQAETMVEHFSPKQSCPSCHALAISPWFSSSML